MCVVLQAFCFIVVKDPLTNSLRPCQAGCGTTSAPLLTQELFLVGATKAGAPCGSVKGFWEVSPTGTSNQWKQFAFTRRIKTELARLIKQVRTEETNSQPPAGPDQIVTAWDSDVSSVRKCCAFSFSEQWKRTISTRSTPSCRRGRPSNRRATTTFTAASRTTCCWAPSQVSDPSL